MVTDRLNQIWTGVLQFLTQFVTPDWGKLIGVIPVLLVLAVVGPIVTILVIAWLRFGLVRPRRHVELADTRRPAELDADGRPVYPAGEPYSPAEAMVYEPGATRSVSGETLVVACPKCGLVRSAERETCGNCGLSFHLKPVARSGAGAHRPTGGAAAA